MYNRYIPGTNGVYERRSVQETECSKPTTYHENTPEIKFSQHDITDKTCCRNKSVSSGLDTGDLLVLCILLLLLIDSDEEDVLPIIITAVAFLFF